MSVAEPKIPESLAGCGVTSEEWVLREQLASAYHVVEHLGWSESIYGHITLKVPGPERHFLINPYGLRYDEVTAENLVKIDLAGQPVGPIDQPVNVAGYVIHSAVHEARPDLACVFHTHTTAGMAVAAQADGLLPISIHASGFFNRIGYHDYEGPSLEGDEKSRLVASLGEHKVLILKNHGLLAGGTTLEEAFILMFRLQRACEIQIAARAGGADLVIPDESTCQAAAEMIDRFLAGNPGHGVGKLEFDAWVRLVKQRPC
ncbi:MAG: class II aldolase/adducin family protein [Planctomycetota bacterium]|jgi:ribulose-5-phosphate 4-epimerase/fuculose-1-phosphate aldolase|nr:class II aldolase/adducin family protein [Planctomycetota bacterium]MEE3364504.1 class II aldolase/adducin family protein [Planctomycetota bacterium]